MKTRALVLALVACGCGKSGGGRSPLPDLTGTGKAEVTYRPGVRVLDENVGVDAIVGQSTDGWTLVLDPAAAHLQDIKAGDVLVIKNQIARKVIAVEPQPDGRIAVFTQSPTIGEAVQQGHIQLDAGVRFSAEGASLEPTDTGVLDRLAALIEGTAHADPSPESKGAADARRKIIKNAAKAIYEGWEATFSATPEAGRLNLDIQLTKSVGGFKALITGKGYIADFDVSSQIDVSGGAIEKLKMISRNINGRMDFTWEVGKESPGIETGKAYIKLPAAISIPLYMYLDGFPLFLDVSAAILIQPAFTGGSEITKGSFHITYDGSQGFDIAGGTTTAGDGSITGDSAIDSVQGVSPAAPVGIVVSFAAPRIELTFGLNKVFKPTQIQMAADVVDRISDFILGKALGADGLAKWKASPMGGFSIGKAVESILQSDATAYFEFETSTGATHSGSAAIVPCVQSEMHLAAVVGAGAQFLGAQVAHTQTTVYKKDFTKVDPPNLKVCQ